MLEKGTKVKIISKSIGIRDIYFKIGYIIDVRNGNDKFDYGHEYYSISSYKHATSGDHYLECDLIQPDFFSDKDFEI